MMIGTAYERLGKKDLAAIYYREILQLSPRFAPVANNLAWIMSETTESKLDEAKSLAEVALQEMPGEPAVMDTVGWINYKQGSLRTAISLIEDAVDIERNRNEGGIVNPEILYHLSVVKEASGERKDAMTILQEARRNIALLIETKPSMEKNDSKDPNLDKSRDGMANQESVIRDGQAIVNAKTGITANDNSQNIDNKSLKNKIDKLIDKLNNSSDRQNISD